MVEVRKLLGELPRVATRTVTWFTRATVDEIDWAVGVVSAIRSPGAAGFLKRLLSADHIRHACIMIISLRPP
jgi:hypothetical protein